MDSTPIAAPKKVDHSYLIWTFLIPFSLMLLLYALDGVFPFGDRSVLVLDLNGQYIGFFEALRDFVYGDGSMLYSFARSLGGEMMGIYAYYLASPLSYIVALFPAAYMTEALLCMFLVKTGLCGLTFGIYLHKKKYVGPTETVLFSTLYALTSFAVVMQHNTMWTDNLILLPLLTLGIEAVVKYRRYRLFVISLSLALLSNFYIGYMTCIYVLLYFFYYFYAYGAGRRNDPLHEKQHYLRAILRMALYSCVAIGIAAIIILTVLYSLSFGKNDFTEPDYAPVLQFNPLQFFAKMLPGVYDTVEPEGLPFVFSGTLTLLLVPLYFLNRRFKKSERITAGIFLAVFYISMSVSSLDMLWHGGQAPNWLNYRYAFFLCFILLTLSARGYSRLQDLPTRHILSVAVVLVALLSVVAAMGFDFLPLPTALVALGFILLFCALLYAMRKSDKKPRQYLAMLLLCLSLCEVFFNGSHMIAALHEDVGSTNRAEYRNYHETTGKTVEWVKERDESFYRMEVIYHRVTNDVMELGYRGLTNSTSTLNADTITFLNRLGMLSTSHWSEYYGRTVVLDSLLGLRYIVTPQLLKLSDLYEEFEHTASNAVHYNPYALPIAFAASEAVRDYDMGKMISPLARQNELLSALLGREADVAYLPLDAEEAFENLTCEVEVHDGIDYFVLYSDVFLENEDAVNAGTVDFGSLVAPDASVTFKTTAARDGELFFYVPTGYETKMEMLIDGAYYGDLFGSNDGFVKGLGYYHAGDTVEVTLRMKECCYFMYPVDAVMFYQECNENIAPIFTELQEGGIRLTDFTEDSFYGRITATEERPVIQTTIPYDAGWIVRIDGREVATYETLDALLAFDAPAGTHTVEMVYRPRAYLTGRAISLISLAVFVLLITAEELFRRGKLCPCEGGRLYACLSVFFYRGTIREEEEVFEEEAANLPQEEAEDGGEDTAL